MRRPFVATFTLLAGAGAGACSNASSSATPPDSSTTSAADSGTALDTSPVDNGDVLADVGGDAPACPDVRPIIGSECHLPRTLLCPFPDPCPQAPTTGSMDTFFCLSAMWTTDLDAYMLDCPTPPPAAGSECLCAAHQMNEGCINLHCVDGAPSGWVICDDESKQWIQQPLPCNPPGADAGDASGADVDGGDAAMTDAPPDGESGP